MKKEDIFLTIGTLVAGGVLIHEVLKTKKKNKVEKQTPVYVEYDDKVEPLESLVSGEDEPIASKRKNSSEIFEDVDEVLVSAIKEILIDGETTKMTKKEFQSAIIQKAIMKMPTDKYTEFLPQIPLSIEGLEQKVKELGFETEIGMLVA